MANILMFPKQEPTPQVETWEPLKRPYCLPADGLSKSTVDDDRWPLPVAARRLLIISAAFWATLAWVVWR